MIHRNRHRTVSQAVGVLLIAVTVITQEASSIAQESKLTFLCQFEDDNGMLSPLSNAFVWVPYGSKFNRDRISEFSRTDLTEAILDPTDSQQTPLNTLVKEGNKMTPKSLFVQANQHLFVHNKSETFFQPTVLSFNNGLTVGVPPGETSSYLLPKPDNLPSVIRNDFEDLGTVMLLIQPHPFGGISNEMGVATISALPADEWEFTSFHEQFGHPIEASIVNGTAVKMRKNHFKVRMETDSVNIQLVWKKSFKNTP